MKKFLKIIGSIVAFPIDLLMVILSTLTVVIPGLISAILKGKIKQRISDIKADFKLIKFLYKEIMAGSDVTVVLSKAAYSNNKKYEYTRELRTKELIK